MKILRGHNSPETAAVNHNYPYGRLRCTIKFWLETDAKKGTRFCSQTVNPKNGRVNAPKKSTYALFGVMTLDESNGHIGWTAYHHSGGESSLRHWLNANASGLCDIGFATAGRFFSQVKSYERLKAAGVPWEKAGAYVAAIGLPRKDGDDRMPFSTADAVALYASRTEK